MDTFDNDLQAIAWVEAKIMELGDDTYAPRHHENWKLTEYYVVRSKGTEGERKCRVAENLQKNASDMAGGLACLGIENEPKKAKTSCSERHRTSVNKLIQACNKLGRILSQCESSMPALKRSLTHGVYHGFKEGVTKSRQVKEDAMDKLEDMKMLPTEEADQEAIITKTKEIMQNVVTHGDALLEALRLHQPPPSKPIKKEGQPAAASAAHAAADVQDAGQSSADEPTQ